MSARSRRATRRKYSTEDKIRIVLSGLRGEYAIAELCRREGIAESLLSLSEISSELDHVAGSGNLTRNDRLPEAADVLADLGAQVEETT